MFQVKPESPFPALAQAWSRAEPPDAAAVESTREALSTVRPEDLGAVAPLAEALFRRLGDAATREPARRALFALLDGVRRRHFTTLLERADLDAWLGIVLRAVREADYGFGELLRSREQTDPKTVAVRVLAEPNDLTVADLSRRTRAIARGILGLVDGAPDAKVAILAENCLEGALCDLACLSNGIVDFPLPANAVAEQLVYMLKHSGARVLLVADEEQLAKVLPSLPGLTELEHVVVFSRTAAERNGLLSLDQMVSQGAEFDDAIRAERAAAIKATDVATVMYTSGTTGKPKGIVFTHENIVTKRFARAFALPHVSEGDIFLCYLPLYHTFGRWLELTGTLFWGATYVFARSTAQSQLLEDFKRVKPTVFISVPKKWMELHEAARWDASAEEDPDEVTAHLRVITGGRLRYGLSAAGYLDPNVFRTFHAAGTELCSGYGMTEATGGITMTPPGEYLDDSVGQPLPGIECRRADDGELLIRGPYVSPGYFRGGDEETVHDADGWFHTGDLVSLDPAGHFRITGRKKEIYKNRQGQTIAPQRVENLFRDFEAISQAFLVGDHREYNTLLVWPNPASPQIEGRPEAEVRELISSLVASANRFLAPYERVVGFQILPRALDLEHGELTHKHTFRRENVEKGWRELVDRLYEQKHLAFPVDGGFIRIPNWVLREMGVLQHEVTVRDGALRAGERTLTVGATPEAPGSIRVGDLAYSAEGTVFDLGALLSRPSLWLGNDALRRFIGDEAFISLTARRRKGGGDIRIDPRLWLPPAPDRLWELLRTIDAEPTMLTLHAAAELLRAERPEARLALEHLHRGVRSDRPDRAGRSRAILRRAAEAPDEDIRRRGFRLLFPHEEPGETLDTLRRFLDRMGPFALRDDDLASLPERGITDAQVSILLAFLASDEALRVPRDASDRRLVVGAMRLVAATAIAHPLQFAPVRVPLARLTLLDDPEIAARAGEEFDRLRRGFTNWIGPNLRLAIDPKTGAEYGWKDVLAFDANVAPAAQHHLLQALEDTTIVRASVFLLGRGVLLSLADIPPGGAAISLLGRQHGKSVYRLSIHTRSNEVFDVAINVADEMNFAELRAEVNWLLAAGATPPLVEQFGGYFAEWGIFTEEFIPGDTVEKQVARLVRQGEPKRIKGLWPFIVWSALEGHVRFWDRTGRRLALREPSPAAFIVPSHDYHSGARLVSISDRSPCAGLDELLQRFEHAFVQRLETSRPELRGDVDDVLVLSAVVEALGLERGVAMLSAAAQESRRAVAIETFLERVRAGGFTPKRVHFAARRYRRWLEVNPAATIEAQGKMLGDQWDTYHLSELEAVWPDTRLRFFRLTVFAGAREELGTALDRLMQRARTLPPGGLDLEESIAALRGAIAPTAEEDYFLARLTYRYLAPTDQVALITMPHHGHYVTELVVAHADEDGNRFTVRGPVSPREVARLLHMFHEANLRVNFTTDHEFLLCLDARETVIGGLFYRQAVPDRVYMEKLVVGRKQRGKGVASHLMGELFRRLAARGVQKVETGFFQPEYLARYGFRTDPTSGGLICEVPGASPPPDGPPPAAGPRPELPS